MHSPVPYMKAIWAESANGVIGRQGRLPWKSREDLRIFRQKTKGSTVIMGRKTWDSLPLKPLPDRRNFILSKSLFSEPRIGFEDDSLYVGQQPHIPQLFVYEDPKYIHHYLNCLSLEDRQQTWVIGGEEIFRLLWEYVAELHITIFPDLFILGDTASPISERQKELADHWKLEESQCRYIRTDSESLDHLVFSRKTS